MDLAPGKYVTANRGAVSPRHRLYRDQPGKKWGPALKISPGPRTRSYFRYS